MNKLRYFLPSLLTLMTGKQRYLPEIQWSHKSWTHNVFRFYELIFWRKFGIRPEISTSNENGITTYQAHSFEGACALFETWIRSKFKLPVKVWIPKLSNPAGLPFPSENYMFAIAWDNYAENTTTGTTITFSYTVTGSNPLILGFGVDITGGSHDVLTGMKYNNVSLSFVQKNVNADMSNYGYILAGPATGANTFEVDLSSSTSWRSRIISYSGCAQSGQPDNSTTSVVTGLRPQSFSLTPVADNCWLVGGITCGIGAASLSSGGTDRSGGASTMNISDNNAAIHPAASTTLTWTSSSGSGSETWNVILVSIAPSLTIPSTFFSFFN